MKLTHNESRLLKKIKSTGGLFESEIDKQVFPSFTLRKLVKAGLVHKNMLNMYVATEAQSEWANARCEYDAFNKWMARDETI